MPPAGAGSGTGSGTGRRDFHDLRAAWAWLVRRTLDAAAGLRARAGAAADPRDAARLFKTADDLEARGPAAVPDKGKTADELTALWEKEVGGSMKDPAFRDKVYRAAARLRELETERAERALADRPARPGLKKKRPGTPPR